MDQIRRLAEEIGKSIPADERAILDAGSNHDYRCRCETCRQWWKLMGPDGGEEYRYGPFTKEEIDRP